LQDAEARPLLARLPEEERLQTWRLARTKSALPGHGTGVPELLATMRVTRPAGRLLGLVPDGVLDRVYAQIARHRGSLGRLVPDGHAPRRFP
jgi:hypothetical protein